MAERSACGNRSIRPYASRRASRLDSGHVCIGRYKSLKRVRQADQDTPLPQFSPPECAKQRAAPASRGEAALPAAEATAADERQAQVLAIASNLLYWKGGLKILRQAQLPKWRGSFQWQIEAKIEAMQTSYATLRAEAADGGG